MPFVTRNLRDGTIRLQDGAGHEIVLEVEEGDLNYSEASNIVNVLDRGRLSHMRPGNQEPVRVSFSIKYRYAIAVGLEPLSPYEVLHRQAGAVAWTTTNDDGGDVFTLDLQFTIRNPGANPAADEKIWLRKVPLPGISFEEGDEFDKMSFDGQAFVTQPAFDRVTTTTTTTTTP